MIPGFIDMEMLYIRIPVATILRLQRVCHQQDHIDDPPYTHPTQRQ